MPPHVTAHPSAVAHSLTPKVPRHALQSLSLGSLGEGGRRQCCRHGQCTAIEHPRDDPGAPLDADDRSSAAPQRLPVQTLPVGNVCLDNRWGLTDGGRWPRRRGRRGRGRGRSASAEDVNEWGEALGIHRHGEAQPPSCGADDLCGRGVGGDATSGGRTWTGMTRGLESGTEACEDEIRSQRRTDMGWTPMRTAQSEVERPD